MRDYEALYARLPVPAQNLMASVEGLHIRATRYGTGFRKALAAAESRQWWSQEAIEDFRDRRLRATVAHAFATVPHYRDLARRLKITAADIRGLADMEALPILTKAEIQDAPERFVSSGVPPGKRRTVHTSGTTGAGLRFSTTLGAQQEQWAVWWRYRRMHGIDMGTWCGYFGGRSIVPVESIKPPYWRYNWTGHQILFSGYHLSPRTLDAYIQELRTRKPPWLHGYPSILAILAGHLLDTSQSLGYQVRWITTGAESLLSGQRHLITRAFEVSPIENYGLAEAVANAATCPRGRLHLDDDFAAVELLPTKQGSLHIVGSNLSNRATPLLRYATGDLASGPLQSCGCKRPGRILADIDGRREDNVKLRDGTLVGRMDHIFKDLVSIREAQIFQPAPGELVILVARGPRFTSSDEARLREEVNRRLGSDITLTIEYVERIARTANGKLRLVVSALPHAQESRA